jgi:hypothetical protein
VSGDAAAADGSATRDAVLREVHVRLAAALAAR